jgi:hypothetical protein
MFFETVVLTYQTYTALGPTLPSGSESRTVGADALHGDGCGTHLSGRKTTGEIPQTDVAETAE